MAIITLKNMAKLTEKSIQEVYETAKEGKAIITSPTSSEVFIDINKYQKHLDEEIINGLKNLN